MSAAIYPPLTAYRVHRDDGTSKVQSMAAGVTLDQARAYLIGQTESDDTENIRFIRRTVIAVTPFDDRTETLFVPFINENAEKIKALAALKSMSMEQVLKLKREYIASLSK